MIITETFTFELIYIGLWLSKSYRHRYIVTSNILKSISVYVRKMISKSDIRLKVNKISNIFCRTKYLCDFQGPPEIDTRNFQICNPLTPVAMKCWSYCNIQILRYQKLLMDRLHKNRWGKIAAYDYGISEWHLIRNLR